MAVAWASSEGGVSADRKRVAQRPEKGKSPVSGRRRRREARDRPRRGCTPQWACGPQFSRHDPQTFSALFSRCSLPGTPLLLWRGANWNRLGSALRSGTYILCVFSPQEAQNSHVYWVSVSLQEVELRKGWQVGDLTSGEWGLCNAGVDLCCLLLS